MSCLICGNDNLKTVDTVVSDFVMARIAPNTGGGIITKQSYVIALNALLRFTIIDSMMKKMLGFMRGTEEKNTKSLEKSMSAGIQKR